MTYAAELKELAGRVDALDARHKAALFWLAGSGLLVNLRPPATWSRWIEEARTIGYQYVVTGDVPDDALGLWERAQSPTDTDSSQLLNSTIICLSTPPGLATGRAAAVGPWLEHALFPLMQHESLELWGDVAVPDDDDELEQVFSRPLVQAGVTFFQTAIERLKDLEGVPDGSLVQQLLPAATVLAAPDA